MQSQVSETVESESTRTHGQSICGLSKCSLTEKRGQVQIWLNLVLVMSLQIPRAVSYTIVLPSLYQFVTAPTFIMNGTFDQHNRTLSGLGQSDLFYSWAVGLFSISAIIISPITGVLPRLISYRFSIILFLLVFMSGALIYALTVEPWMILTARFLLGIYDGAAPILLFSFASETASKIEGKTKTQNQQGVKRARYSLKDKLIAADLIHKSILFLATLGVSTIMAQFPQIDQYRWPGWFLFTLGLVYTIIFISLYREDQKLNCGGSKNSKQETNNRGIETVGPTGVGEDVASCFSGKCAFAKFQKISCVNVLVISYCVYCGYVTYSLYNISDTLLSPVLSDLFGFNIAQNSIFFLTLMFVTLSAGIILISLKCFKIDNRVVMIISLCVGIIGFSLSSDWQAIGEDPCATNKYFITNLTSFTIDGGDIAVCADIPQDLGGICSSSSHGSHQCLLNCVSRVTGLNCPYCLPLCRSDEKLINFAQFTIGIILIIICLQLSTTVIVSITTDVTPLALQGIAISAVFTANSVARTVTPLWISRIYVVFERHTYPPLLVVSGTLVLALIGTIVLYKRLRPRKNENISAGLSNPLAVSNLDVSNEEMKNFNGSEIDLSVTIF